MRRCLRASLSLAAYALVAGVPHAACQTVQYRIVAHLNEWGPAISPLVEGTPGTFYFIAASNPEAVVSITPQGTKNPLTTFASGVQLPSALVSGANGRYYSALEPGNQTENMFP